MPVASTDDMLGTSTDDWIGPQGQGQQQGDDQQGSPAAPGERTVGTHQLYSDLRKSPGTVMGTPRGPSTDDWLATPDTAPRPPRSTDEMLGQGSGPSTDDWLGTSSQQPTPKLAGMGNSVQSGPGNNAVTDRLRQMAVAPSDAAAGALRDPNRSVLGEYGGLAKSAIESTVVPPLVSAYRGGIAPVARPGQVEPERNPIAGAYHAVTGHDLPAVSPAEQGRGAGESVANLVAPGAAEAVAGRLGGGLAARIAGGAVGGAIPGYAYGGPTGAAVGAGLGGLFHGVTTPEATPATLYHGTSSAASDDIARNGIGDRVLTDSPKMATEAAHRSVSESGQGEPVVYQVKTQPGEVGQPIPVPSGRNGANGAVAGHVYQPVAPIPPERVTPLDQQPAAGSRVVTVDDQSYTLTPAKAALWDALDTEYQKRVQASDQYSGGDTQMAAGQRKAAGIQRTVARRALVKTAVPDDLTASPVAPGTATADNLADHVAQLQVQNGRAANLGALIGNGTKPVEIPTNDPRQLIVVHPSAIDPGKIETSFLENGKLTDHSVNGSPQAAAQELAASPLVDHAAVASVPMREFDYTGATMKEVTPITTTPRAPRSAKIDTSIPGREKISAHDATYAKMPVGDLLDELHDQYGALDKAHSNPMVGYGWTRFDDDQQVMRSGSGLGASIARSQVGFAQDRVNALERELARRGVSPDEIAEHMQVRRARALERPLDEGEEGDMSFPAAPPELAKPTPAGETTARPQGANDVVAGAGGAGGRGDASDTRVAPGVVAPGSLGSDVRGGPVRPAAGTEAGRGVLASGASPIRLDRLDLDPSGQTELAAEIARLNAAGKLPTGRQSFADMRQQASAFAKSIGADPLTVDQSKLKNLSGPEIVGMKNIVSRNTSEIVEASRLMADPDIAPATKAMLSDRLEALRTQRESLLSSIITNSSQAGRDLGFLRQIATRSVDPDVWEIQARRAAGRPLSDVETARIRGLAQDASDLCGQMSEAAD